MKPQQPTAEGKKWANMHAREFFQKGIDEIAGITPSEKATEWAIAAGQRFLRRQIEILDAVDCGIDLPKGAPGDMVVAQKDGE
jgi:hypothetical protein